jgi:hypothetical protein
MDQKRLQMDNRTIEQLILDREITQLAIRIDRIHNLHSRSIPIAKLEHLVIREALTYATHP